MSRLELLPTEVVCQILSGVSNAFDLLSLTDTYIDTLEVYGMIQECVTHIDIMYKDDSSVSYTDYIKIVNMMSDLPNIKSYNLHLIFDKQYDEQRQLDIIKKLRREKEDAAEVRKLELSLKRSFVTDITNIITDTKLISYALYTSSYKNFFSIYVNDNKDTIFNQYSTRYKQYGTNFYNRIQDLIVYDHGVFIDRTFKVTQAQIKKISNIGIHTVVSLIIQYYILPVVVLVESDLNTILLKLKENDRNGGTIVSIIPSDGIELEIHDFNRVATNIMYPLVTRFDLIVPREFVVRLQAIFPNVEYFKIE